MHAVVEAEGFCAPSITALNIPVSSNMKKISKQRVQDLIDEWVIGGYFVEMNDGIQLGPRAIGEFGDYLIAKFGNRILLCFLCSQPTFKVSTVAKDLLHWIKMFSVSYREFNVKNVRQICTRFA